MDTKEAGRLGGLKSGAMRTEAQIKARSQNLAKARERRWPELTPAQLQKLSSSKLVTTKKPVR